MKISLVHPSRGRAQMARDNQQNWIAKASGLHEIEHILSLDTSDPQLELYADLFDKQEGGYEQKMTINDNKNCVQATNHGAAQATGDILIYLSDDFDCPQNWDAEIYVAAFPDGADNGCWVLHVNDGITKMAALLTIPIISRAVYEHNGWFWHPSYQSMWCDNDLYEVCKMNGWLIAAPELTFQHIHWMAGLAKRDAVNLAHDNQQRYQEGQRIFNQRKARGFMDSYSQNNEQDIIFNHFKGHIGTVLDIGANDGKTLSNSYAVIRKGWTGVLVEPSKEAYERLRKNMAGYAVQCVNAAIGTTNGKVPFFENGSHLGKGDVSLLSTTVATEVNRWNDTTNTFTETTVDMMDFASLLTYSQVKHFDLITIDAEGQDYEILQQIDLRAVKCRMLIVEFNGKNKHLYVDFAKYYGMRLLTQNNENLIFVR